MNAHVIQKGTLTWLRWIATFLALIVATMVFYAYFLEQPYLSYQNRPFPPSIEKVTAGEPVPLIVERCNSADHLKSYKTTHSIRSETTGITTMLPDVRVSIKPGCHRSISKVNEVPKGTAPDIYTVYGIAIAEGSLRNFNVPWSSEPFEVIARVKP